MHICSVCLFYLGFSLMSSFCVYFAMWNFPIKIRDASIYKVGKNRRRKGHLNKQALILIFGMEITHVFLCLIALYCRVSKVYTDSVEGQVSRVWDSATLTDSLRIPPDGQVNLFFSFL